MSDINLRDKLYALWDAGKHDFNKHDAVEKTLQFIENDRVKRLKSMHNAGPEDQYYSFPNQPGAVRNHAMGFNRANRLWRKLITTEIDKTTKS